MKIVDLHTDFILGQAKLDKLFGVKTSSQINEALAIKAEVMTLLAGFSYDDWLGKTEAMLSATEEFVANSKSSLKIIPHLEGAQILATNKDLFKQFVGRGVRSIGLAHTENNSLCGSSSSDLNLGLTKAGKALIKNALKEKMFIDLAHMSPKGFNQTLKILGSLPPVISHTACFDIEPNPRNTTDVQIIEIAKRGGVVGIFFSGKYINSKTKPTIKDAAHHVDHVVQIGGIDCAAIGSDFGGITTGTPEGLENITKLQDLLFELGKLGYKNQDLEKIANKNASRVLKLYL